MQLKDQLGYCNMFLLLKFYRKEPPLQTNYKLLNSLRCTRHWAISQDSDGRVKVMRSIQVLVYTLYVQICTYLYVKSHELTCNMSTKNTKITKSNHFTYWYVSTLTAKDKSIWLPLSWYPVKAVKINFY